MNVVLNSERAKIPFYKRDVIGFYYEEMQIGL